MALGYPLVKVELDDNQLNYCIARATEVYTKYAYLGADKYLVVDMNNYKPGKGLTFRLNERTGQELSVTVEINKKKTDASVMPFGIVLICPFS